MGSRATDALFDRHTVSGALRMLDGLFASGTPIAAAQVLGGVASLFGATGAATMVGRIEANRPAIPAVDSLIYTNEGPGKETYFDGVVNSPQWDNDPVARALRQRIVNHPGRPFTYSLLKMARRYPADAPLYGVQFLQSVGWTNDCCSIRPIDDTTVSFLCAYRSDPRPFTRSEIRLLAMLHEVIQPRVVEMRGNRLRDELPHSLRPTFSLVLCGHTEKEIARLTNRSPNTVHDHVKRIYQHFQVGSRAQLLSRFVDVDRLNGRRH